MLSMLAVGGLFAAFAPMAFQIQVAAAQPVNVAAASNEDNDKVLQSNYADVDQESKIKCKASAESENDKSVQVGSNQNIAANDCDSKQSADVDQDNDNYDNDVQIAAARADQEICQQIAFLGLQVCP